MEKKILLTKILTSVGMILIWFPIIAPIFFSVGSIFTDHRFRFDFLMPAELFPSVLLGGGVLLWAAFRAHARRNIIGWGLGLAIVFPVVGQVLASVTGLASGAIEPTGWPWALVLGMMGAYILAVITTGIGGGLLLRDLFKSPMKVS